jgi:uncharacterized protein (TIGR02145 family)
MTRAAHSNPTDRKISLVVSLSEIIHVCGLESLSTLSGVWQDSHHGQRDVSLFIINRQNMLKRMTFHKTKVFLSAIYKLHKKHNGSIVIALCSVFMLSFKSSVFAQSPDRMAYQSVIRNSSGALLSDKVVGLRISILKGSVTGTVVFSETHRDTTNAYGLVQVDIGAGTVVSGIMSGIDWSQGPYYIRVETDPAGGTNYQIVGTTQLLSVPYSLYAGNVSSSLSQIGDTLRIGSKKYIIPGIKDVTGIQSSTGITAHTCGAAGVHNASVPYATMTDQDGNTYRTVQIGTQVWMAENLKTTKYRNGVSIAHITDNQQWVSDTNGAYCSYSNNIINDCPYGKLYNFYAVVNTNNICPTGWHVPTESEWLTLTNFLGGSTVAGGKMKVSSSTYWDAPNTGATNQSGFSALPAGIRAGNDGSFGNNKGYTYIWSTTQSGGNAKFNYMAFDYAEAPMFTYPKGYGFSVRCIKD